MAEFLTILIRPCEWFIMTDWFDRYPIEYAIGTDEYDGRFEFRLGSLRYFDSGGYCYYNLHSYIVETLGHHRLEREDIQFVIQNRDGVDMFIEREDFFSFSDIYVWEGFQPDFIIVGDGFTMQWEGAPDQPALRVSFEDESRYKGLAFAVPSNIGYRVLAKPEHRITNGLYGYETADRFRRLRFRLDDPDIEEIRSRVSAAVQRMECPPDRIFMLIDPNVSDILLFLDRPAGDEPPENSCFQPLFGNRVHVFGIHDLRGCGPVSCICVYDSGRESTILGALSEMESDLEIIRSLDDYRHFMAGFERFHTADYLDAKNVRNVYIDFNNLSTEHCWIYIQMDEPEESYELRHPLSRIAMLDLTVLAVDHPLDGRGLLNIYHNRRFDPPIDNEAVDREIQELIRDIPCYDRYGNRVDLDLEN